MAHFPGLCNSTHTMTEMVIKRAPSMVVGELYTLRLKDDLPAVVKGDPEAAGKITAK